MRRWKRHCAESFTWALMLAIIGCAALGVQTTRAAEQERQNARMKWWRDAKFGMFIHWGVYAVPAGVWDGKAQYAEWIRNGAHIPVSVYETLANDFNPVRYDPSEWVRMAREAGMKYMVITSKHHDGFCIFDSEFTEWDVVDASPYGKDLLRQLRRAAREQDFKLGYYYSIMDWHHPDYLPRRGWSDRPAEGADMDRYTEYARNQVRELLYRYDPAILWFDGGWENTWTEERGREMLNTVRELAPNVIVNDRLGVDGDYITPEQHIPGQGMDRDWETCMTMNNHWGYARYDDNWKSVEMLIHNLVDIVSKGGNYLLNVGPKADGTFPKESVERLKAIGEWMDANGESIYGTSASPFRRLRWGRCTVKRGRLYLHVFEWPEDGTLEVHGLKNEVRGAYLLAFDRPAELKVSDTGDPGPIIHVPEKAPDPIDTVVVLEIEGRPEVAPWTARQAGDGSVTLRAIDATIHGDTARYESGGGKDNIGYWTDPDDYVTWEMKIDEPGTFDVSLTYAAESTVGYRISAAGQTLEGTLDTTGGYARFKTVELGTLDINGSGKYILMVRRSPQHGPINLQTVKLAPAE